MKKITIVVASLMAGLFLNAQSVIQLEGVGNSSAPVFEVLDVTATNNGDKIIVGRLRPTTTNTSASISHDFDPSGNIIELPNLSPTSGQVGFIASYDKFGNVNYANQITDADIQPSVVNVLVESDSQNNIYVLGIYLGKADLDPGTNIEEVNSGNIFTSGFYLASYDEDGNFRFGVQLPNIFNVTVSSFYNNNEINKILEVDDNGNSYLLVQPNDDEYDFDPSGDVFTIPFTKGVISYDNNGNFRYGYLAPFDTKDLGISPDGTQYLSGVLNESFDDDFDFDPSSNSFTLGDVTGNSFYFSSYSPNGELNFVNDIKGPNNAIPSIITGNGNGDIFIVGKMSGTIDFDPSPTDFNVSVSEFEPDPSGDLFIAKYNAQGELQMAKAVQDKINNVCSETITDMEVDASGNITITGSLNGGIVDFDASSTTLEVNGGASGADTFVASYDEAGEPIFAYSVQNSLQNFSSLALDVSCDFYHLATNLRENINVNYFQNDVAFSVTTGFEQFSNLWTMLLISIEDDIIPTNSACDILNINESNIYSNISISPNPFKDVLSLNAQNFIEFNVVKVLDLTGKIVYQSDENLRSIDLKHLQSGVYILSLQADNEKVNFKIVKQ